MAQNEFVGKKLVLDFVSCVLGPRKKLARHAVTDERTFRKERKSSLTSRVTCSQFLELSGTTEPADGTKYSPNTNCEYSISTGNYKPIGNCAIDQSNFPTGRNFFPLTPATPIFRPVVASRVPSVVRGLLSWLDFCSPIYAPKDVAFHITTKSKQHLNFSQIQLHTQHAWDGV
jgi:hypothetical protein